MTNSNYLTINFNSEITFKFDNKIKLINGEIGTLTLSELKSLIEEQEINITHNLEADKNYNEIESNFIEINSIELADKVLTTDESNDTQMFDNLTSEQEEVVKQALKLYQWSENNKYKDNNYNHNESIKSKRIINSLTTKFADRIKFTKV